MGQLQDRPQMLSTTVSEPNTSQASEVTDLFETKISQKHVMCWFLGFFPSLFS